jgi:glycosyltransferase involved in cell wall biosynthesis
LQSSAIKRQFNGLMKHGFRYMASHIDEMVFVSRAEQERLIADGFVPPANRGRVIHNGLDVTAFIERVNRTDVAKKRHEQGLNPATKVVLFPARLDQENNSLAFFDFYREFMARDSGLNVHFLVAGNGHYGDYFESELKQAPYSANISFLGYREDIPELLAASDALLTLTLAEAFGIRVLEGMAAGVPAIGYGTGGIPELLEGTGAMEYLASVGDISEAVDKAIALLQRLTSEPESKASFVQTLQQRASLFTMEAFLQGYLQLYNDCLTQGRE